MTTTLIDDLERVTSMVAEARSRLVTQISAASAIRDRLHEALQVVDKSWSGSNVGYHAELYFKDFSRPALGDRFDPEWGGIHGIPEGWRDRDIDEVKVAIEARCQCSVDSFLATAREFASQTRAVVSEVTIAVAAVRSLPGLDDERQLLDRLEELDLEPGVPIRMPPAMSRDSMAIAQGQRLGPHQELRHYIARASKSMQASQEALDLAHRVCRQATAKVRQAPPTSTSRTGSESIAVSLVRMFRRFDDAARALSNRQRGRPDFEINDEYDVQDLVGAILRLHFDDVRPEEWTPSYAGGSSRIDFLLKREEVVVEIKKTRPGLTDRKVGEELTIDAGRYRAHPDAKVLVCLVHDPGRHINNPRGLEDDLAKLSDDRLEIAVVIAP